MAQRLMINRREQFAIDFNGNPMPVYIEDEPSPKPEGFVSTMICPECDNGVLVKGATGPDNSVPYRCNNGSACGVKWIRKDQMEPDVILEMGGYF